MHSHALQFPSISVSSMSISFISPGHLYIETFCFTYPPCSKVLPNSISVHRPVISRCGNGPQEITGGDNNLKDALSGMVGKQVEELLNREENRGLLDGLEKASQRVEMAKRQLVEIERQELEAKLLRDYVTQLETRASENASGRS
ncbi:uncharacterized protein LOC110807346 [Carica papaya]|uniref:uncharacterized protein LOC110807346 n=1 Tax=Carica papaya TaxID=3649 RepID=UPI000B8CFD4B|nr:uncharacterized protein LOC110807346 [Carica papaya]